MTFEFISYARCAEIRFEISSTALTLEVSKNPCRIEPKPVDAGLPVVAAPEAGVSLYRLSPIASKPASFRKVAIWSCPTVESAVWPSILTWIWPELLTVTSMALRAMASFPRDLEARGRAVPSAVAI